MKKEIPTTSKRGIVEGFVFPAESGPLSLRFDPCRNWKSDLPPRQSRETTHRQPRERRRARERAGKRIVRFIQTKNITFSLRLVFAPHSRASRLVLSVRAAWNCLGVPDGEETTRSNAQEEAGAAALFPLGPALNTPSPEQRRSGRR